MQTRREREDSDILASCFQPTRISFDSFPQPFDKLSLVFDATLKLKISFNFTIFFFLALKTFCRKLMKKQNRFEKKYNFHASYCFCKNHTFYFCCHFLISNIVHFFNIVNINHFVSCAIWPLKCITCQFLIDNDFILQKLDI